MTKYLKNKAEWTAIIITKGMDKCWKCGYNKHMGAIDFHHVKNDRLKGRKDLISTIFTRKPTPERVKRLEQCIPLCATCHRELHIEEGTLGIPKKLRDAEVINEPLLF